MKFKIVKKKIDHYFVDCSTWNDYNLLSCEEYSKRLANELGLDIKPIYYDNDKISGYRLENPFKGGGIMSYQVWFYDEWNYRNQCWRQYEWSKYSDRCWDNCVLVIREARAKCKECKNKYEKEYGEVVEELIL